MSIETRIAKTLQDRIPPAAVTDYDEVARDVLAEAAHGFDEMRAALRDLAAIIRSTTGSKYQYAIDRAERLTA